MMLSYINLDLPNAVTDEVEYLEEPRCKHPIICKWYDILNRIITAPNCIINNA